MLRRILPVLLVLIAGISSMFLWRIYSVQPAPELTGPPRSDYFLVDFELVALDSDGEEAFRVTGPRLSRHPWLGTVTIDAPHFEFPMQDGNPSWEARSEQAWSSANAREIQLQGDVLFTGNDPRNGTPMEFRTEQLVIRPKQRLAETDAPVSFHSPHSILEGRGLQVDLQASRFQLLHEVKGRYETPHSNALR